MSNNGTGNIGNFGNLVYDSGHDGSSGRNRIGISATEIELLSDIPPSLGTGITTSGNNVSDQARGFNTQIPSSSIDQQKQQNNYQTLSVDRGQSKPNVVYQGGNDQQLTSAVDKLLEKYAPDATPQNLLNTSNNRRSTSQINVVTTRDEPSFSTFQTTTPSSSSTTAHNYSTIIRPTTEQTPQTQINPNYNNDNRNGQTSIRSRPATTYDSFQHVIPPPQQQQRPKSQISVPIKTKNGNFAQVVPGQLYTLDDDPLHLLYDRQKFVPPPPPQQQQPSFNTTFQPSNNFPTVSLDPLTVIYTNASQRYPQQSIPITTETNINGIQPFDLGNLIKRVQQDYLREIQPFVSSVKFVEKDSEYGQSLADIGFTTPVTVRKGFTRQADDILRRSFGRENRTRPPLNRDDENTYSEDDDEDNIDELRPSNRHHPLKKFDSKQSFTSVTSVSTNGSDYDEHYPSLKKRKNKVEVHSQATSPPPQVNQTKVQSQIKNPPAASLDVPTKPIIRNETDEEETTTATPRAVPKLARRVSPDQDSVTSSESATSDDQDDYSAKYNEHELPQNIKPSAAIQAVVTTGPLVKPVDEVTRSIGNQVPQRSDDIHPAPPTTHATVPANSRVQVKKSESEQSDMTYTGSDNVSETEDDDQSAAYNEQPQAPSTAPSNVQSVTSSAQNPPSTAQTTTATNPRQAAAAAPNPRQAAAAAPNPRQAAAAAPNPRQAAAAAPNPRQAAAASTNPPATTAPNPRQAAAASTNPPATTAPNPRQAAAASTNPPAATAPNPRQAAAASTSPPAATGGAAQTGSTRLFQKGNDPKFGAKRSAKDASASIGDKIKSIFRRK